MREKINANQQDIEYVVYPSFIQILKGIYI